MLRHSSSKNNVNNNETRHTNMIELQVDEHNLEERDDVKEEFINKSEEDELWRKEAIATARPTTVRVEDGRYAGNGNIWDKTEEYIIVITGNHVVVDGEDTLVTFFNGTSSKGKVVWGSEEADIAFVKVYMEDIEENTRTEIKKVSVNMEEYKKLKQDDTMFLFGAKEGEQPDLVKGRIGNMWWYLPEFDADVIYNYCEAQVGMSGCGTFDEHFNYIGMLIGGYGDESASVPLVTIMDEYLLWKNKE